MESRFSKIIRGQLFKAPTWAAIILLVALVFGIIKHNTDWPPFLSQLQIFGIGCLLGLAAAVYAFTVETKLEITRKNSKDLTPDPQLWIPETPGFYKHISTPEYNLINLNGNWIAKHNGRQEDLGLFKTAEQLNQAVRTYFQNLHY